MDFVGHHTRDECMTRGPNLRGACPVMIVLPTGDIEHVGSPVEEAFYRFLYQEYGWQPRRLEDIVASGQQEHVVLPHACDKWRVGVLFVIIIIIIIIIFWCLS